MSDLIVSRLGAGDTAGKIAATIDDPDFAGDLVAAWVDPADLGLTGGGASNAADVAFSPTGTVAATDVQAAIAELDSEKASIADFAEAVDDRVAALVAAGSGVAVTYDDAGNLETISRGPVTINAQTGTSYTLVLADAPKFVTMSNAAASTLTVPPNSSVAFPVGTVIEGAQLGAGQVTLTPGVGVTINGTPGLKVAAQYGTFALMKVATDTWLAFGRLSA